MIVGCFSAVLALVPQASAPAGYSDPIERREVRFSSGSIELAGTLLLPAGEGRVPGVVLVHGSGDSDRSNPWTDAWAKALAARGIAVLHPDKRGCGESLGDWKTASFEDLADDAAAGVAWLRDEPRIDAANVGLAGFSQGVDVLPVCAARGDACSFTIAVSGSVVPLLEQIIDEIELGARLAGSPLAAEQRASIEAAHRLAFESATGAATWDELQERVGDLIAGDAALAEPLRGLCAPAESWIWGWVRAVGDFDPLPHWKRTEVPMLFVYGGSDSQVMGAKSVARLREAFADRPRNWSVLEFAPNGHALIRDDLVDFVATWTRDRGAP